MIRGSLIACWGLAAGLAAGCAGGVEEPPQLALGQGAAGGATLGPVEDCDPADPPTVMCGEGACQVAVPACDAQGNAVPCTPGTPATEACNGADDDCDALVDEDCTCEDGAEQACYSGWADTKDVGECHAGVQSCSGGSWGACAGEVLPALEICDGLDNNCEGKTDEGNPGGGKSCSTGSPGACDAGTTACFGGTVQCQLSTQPTAESCDGLDNDCDGKTDEGNPGGGGSCATGLPGPCAAGLWSCQTGKLVCQPKVTEGCTCTPVCDGKTCGPGSDGCGGTCACTWPSFCNGNGQCECPPFPDAKLVNGKCLASCGKYLGHAGLPDDGGGCCPSGCAGQGVGPGGTWDCTYCCAGPPGCK